MQRRQWKVCSRLCLLEGKSGGSYSLKTAFMMLSRTIQNNLKLKTDAPVGLYLRCFKSPVQMSAVVCCLFYRPNVWLQEHFKPKSRRFVIVLLCCDSDCESHDVRATNCEGSTSCEGRLWLVDRLMRRQCHSLDQTTTWHFSICPDVEFSCSGNAGGFYSWV